MTLQKIAQMQLADSSTVIHFARKGATECLWFDWETARWFSWGTIRAFSNTVPDGIHIELNLGDFAATDWRIIRPSK